MKFALATAEQRPAAVEPAASNAGYDVGPEAPLCPRGRKGLLVNGGEARGSRVDLGDTADRAVQDAVGRVWLKREQLTQRVFAALIVEVLPFVGELDDGRRRAVEDAVRFEVETLLRCVAAARGMTSTELDAVLDLGDASLAAAMSLTALHRAHRSAQRAVQWTLRAEIHGSERPVVTAARLSGAFMLIESQITGEIAQMHLAKLRTRPNLKPHELGAVESLLAGDLQRYRLLQQAQRAPITLGPRNVVALVASRSGIADDPGPLLVIQKAAAGHDSGAYHPISATTNLGAILILPTDGHGRAASRRVARLMADAIDAVEPEPGVVCGVGRAEAGADGVVASHAQAVRLVELGRHHGSFAPAMAFDDAFPYLLLAADLRCAREVAERTIEPLRRSPQAEELTETLSVFVDSLWRMSRAAERLGIHRHTLGARIERIQEITGLSLEDPADRLLVELGLRAQDVLRSDEPLGS